MGLLKKLSPPRQALFAFFFLLLFPFPVPLHADTAFLRRLADQPVANFGDAVSIVTHFLNQETKRSDFESQRDFLRQQGILSKRLAVKKADQVIQKGELAEMAIKTLGIRGGITLRLARPWNENFLSRYFFQRYALKEAVFLKLMKDEDIRSVVSGAELISTVSKMSEYRSDE